MDSVSAVEAAEPPRIVFELVLPTSDDAQLLAVSLTERIPNLYNIATFEWMIADRNPNYLNIRRIRTAVRDRSKGAKVILLFDHADGLPSFLSRLKPDANTYVKTQDYDQWKAYQDLKNVDALISGNLQQFAASVSLRLKTDGILTAAERRSEMVRRSRTDSRAEPSQSRPTTLLSELLEVGLTLDELQHIALLENDPAPSALIGSWFDSKRQVALTVAGGYLGAAIACFIGDATIVGTTHGIFSSDAEMGALAGLTALAGTCAIAASYYLKKVRKVASRSLRVQRIINRRRRSS